ncbi:MAG: Nre family DNA repair protein [Thermoplasmata archaeon]
MKGIKEEIAGIPASLCVRCKGARLLCGKASCPIVTKLYLSSSLQKGVRDVAGNSPPSVFVGHNGYPRVRVGPSLPMDSGDTSIYDNPMKWGRMSVEEVAKLRFSLFRGYKLLRVDEASDPGRYLLELHDLAISSKPVPSELEYSKFEGRVDYSPETQPFGPGGYVTRFFHASSSSNPFLEKVYQDTDLNAKEAIVLLYRNGTVYDIQKALSVGMLGKGRYRRIVPTRWAITAVDKTLSNHFLSTIARFEQVDSFLYFHGRRIGNEYYILIFPESYWFEMIEVWNNGSIWTIDRQPVIESDHEREGRLLSSPKIGGSFFAAKLPILEYLVKRERKGGILVVRFIDGDYTMPLGVWQVRENVRAALENESNLESIDQFFSIIRIRRSLDLRAHSKTYLFRKNQKRITEFVS